MTVTPFPGYSGPTVPMFDIESILASIDTMAAQRPVAAQIVSVANGEDTSAKELSRILASDGSTVWFDGSVGTATSNVILNTTSIVSGAVVSCSSLTFTVSKG